MPNTAVLGRVFASELGAGPDTGTNAPNRPLAGVTIAVDGQEETLRAVTDSQGVFRLTNAPAGTFFVHVDGRTAAGSQWPDGDYHPVVGKAWTAVAGGDSHLARRWPGGTVLRRLGGCSVTGRFSARPRRRRGRGRSGR